MGRQMVKVIIGALLLACTSFATEVRLSPENMVLIRGEISAESMSAAAFKLNDLSELRGAANYPIYIVLDSPGGSISDGMDFIEFAKTFKNVNTLTISAASMASAIVEALPGERLMLETGTIMFHRASAQLGGQLEDGEFEARLAYIKSIVRSMERINAKRMCIKLADYKKKVKDEYWLFGEQAVRAKAVDRLVDVSCTKQLIESKTVEEIQTLFFTAKVEFSACPLLKGGKIIHDKEQETQESNNEML